MLYLVAVVFSSLIDVGAYPREGGGDWIGGRGDFDREGGFFSLYLLGHDRRLYLLGQLVFVGTFFAYLLGQFVFVGTKSLILRDLLGHGCGIVGTENPGGAFLYVISFRQNICWDSLYLLGHFVFVGTKNFVFASATIYYLQTIQTI